MGNGNQPNEDEKKPAAISEISLSQALLAPLDAIFKAQIHAARSFLNMILQLGYPHQPLGKDGQPIKDEGAPYNQEFYYDAEIDGKKQTLKVSMPALALVPVAPLAVEAATDGGAASAPAIFCEVAGAALHCHPVTQAFET